MYVADWICLLYFEVVSDSPLNEFLLWKLTVFLYSVLVVKSVSYSDAKSCSCWSCSGSFLVWVLLFFISVCWLWRVSHYLSKGWWVWTFNKTIISFLGKHMEHRVQRSPDVYITALYTEVSTNLERRW